MHVSNQIVKVENIDRQNVKYYDYLKTDNGWGDNTTDFNEYVFENVEQTGERKRVVIIRNYSKFPPIRINKK